MNDTLNKIVELLNNRNWTLYKLAKESGIPYSSLNSMFQKNNQPTIDTLEKICRAFHISMSEFFSDSTPYRTVEEQYTKTEQELIQAYRNLNRSNQKLLYDFIKLLEKR